MPSALTYPGVYVEEISSGVRTIVGVPTSVTAFVGRAARGPTTGPGVPVFSFDDFTRTFGGLDLNYPMTFAVYDYFQNGGAQAVIVRLSGGGTASAAFTDALPGITASSPGQWGKNLWIAKIAKVTQGLADLQQRYNAPKTDFYDVTVVERQDLNYTRTFPGSTTPQEIYQPLRTDTLRSLVFDPRSASSRRVDRVLPYESQLLTVKDPVNLTDLGAPNMLDDADPATGMTRTNPTPVPDSDNRAFTQGGDDGGATLALTDYDFTGRLDRVDIFNIMCLPPDSLDSGEVGTDVLQAALDYCVQRRAMLVVDPRRDWGVAADPSGDKAPILTGPPATSLGELNINGPEARNAAVYFPRVKQSNPLRNGAIEPFVPCGIIAGVMAATDVSRGVWKAPAGIDAAVGGTADLGYNLTDPEQGLLNPLGINCLRTFPVYGRVVWGARTLRGADALADDYKYVPVRRLALYIEESLYRGTKWVVFEPNGETLWAQIRSSVGSFMQGLFRQGAFAGGTPAQAYFVNCDATTNPDILVNQGVVTVKVGFAPLFPAEFVVIQLTQIVGTTG
jgi:phage tail sheath protein FI